MLYTHFSSSTVFCILFLEPIKSKVLPVEGRAFATVTCELLVQSYFSVVRMTDGNWESSLSGGRFAAITLRPGCVCDLSSLANHTGWCL